MGAERREAHGPVRIGDGVVQVVRIATLMLRHWSVEVNEQSPLAAEDFANTGVQGGHVAP